MRAIRTATICHNADDYRDPGHRRVRLELRRCDSDDASDRRYEWWAVGEDEGTGVTGATVEQACAAAADIAWRDPIWDFRAAWLR